MRTPRAAQVGEVFGHHADASPADHEWLIVLLALLIVGGLTLVLVLYIASHL